MDAKQLRGLTIKALVELGQGLKVQQRSAPDPKRAQLIQQVIQIVKEKTAEKPTREAVSYVSYTPSIAYPWAAPIAAPIAAAPRPIQRAAS